MRFINASPQRRQQFRRFQEMDQNNGRAHPLTLILDCRTRWNSTYLMLERAYALRHYIRQFIIHSADALSILGLAPPAWRPVEYLLQLLSDFFLYTKSLSKHTGATIHKVCQSNCSLILACSYSSRCIESMMLCSITLRIPCSTWDQSEQHGKRQSTKVW